MSRIKFLNSGIDLYKQIEKIKKEEKVKAKYCPQWIPIWSMPFLSKSDFDKISYNSKRDTNKYFFKIWVLIQSIIF